MNIILDLIFPKRCVSCRRYGAFLCINCINTLRELNNICPVCEKPSIFGETHHLCRTKYSLDGLISGFYYAKVIKDAIHRFKYRPYITHLAPIFCQLLVKVIKNKKGFNIFLKEKPVFVPIPLHWWRKHIRGYNQALILASVLGKDLRTSVCDILIRNKLTKPQSELSFDQRKKNVENIFSIKDSKLPKNIVLVDDLWTSGATIKNACKILKKTGANKVWALTLAR